MIRQTSPDKVRGKLVKYKLGDCLSILTGSGKYIAAIMTGKFNKYYNLTFIEYCKEEKPSIVDFLNGNFFGTRFGSWEDLKFAVDQKMVECKYVDTNAQIEIIDNLLLVSDFISAGYSYSDSIEELYQYYSDQIPIRILKSANAEKFPDLAFVGKHLVDIKAIIENKTNANSK
jgi:hypothetical protein